MKDAVNEAKYFSWETADKAEHANYTTPKILNILQRLHTKRVLDVGSGNGNLCNDLTQAGFEAVGVEYDAKGVEIARSTFQGIPFYHQGVQDDPLEILAKENGRNFDAVVSAEVVEHLCSPELLPSFASAVLKEGGYLLITTPYHGYLKNLALSIANKWDYHHESLRNGGHIKFWSRDTLRHLLSDNGFEVIEFHGAGRLPFLWKSMILLTKKL